MFAIDDATAVAAMPTPEAAGTPGFFTEGNPGLGQAATYVRASWLNALQQELLFILTAAGITPSKTAYNQILTAMRSNGLIYAIDTGAANACVTTFTPSVSALVDGMVLWFKAKATNTGATTLNVNGLGAAPVVGAAQVALQGGEIVANGKCQVIWNSATNSWVLIECTGAALQVGPATASGHALQLGQATGRVLRASVYMPIAGVASVSVNGGAFTTTGATTFTSLSGTNAIYGKSQAAGGGGGGTAATSTGQVAAAVGGTAGSYGEVWATSGFSGGIPIASGLPGTAGAAGNNAGGAGGSSSIGSLLSCPGGPGGGGGPANAAGNVSVVDTAPSAAPTGANMLAVRGAGGGFIFLLSSGQFIGSRGGASFSGPGPQMQNNGSGPAAVNPGAGGSGANAGASSAAFAGGVGGAGYNIILEYA